MSLQIKEKLQRNSCSLKYKTEIKNSIDYQEFFKKRFSHCRNLSVEYFDTNYYHDNQARQRMQQRLVRLLKKAKPIKSLDLHKCIVQYENIPDSTFIQIAKKTSRVKVLSVPDYAVSQELVKKYALWLKYARRLTKFEYIAPPCSEFPQGQSSSFEKTVPKFFHELRRDRLKSLNITHKIPDEKLGNSLLAFRQYPSTLRSLSFDWKNYSTDWKQTLNPLTSLSHMRDLTSLALSFRNQADILYPMISSLESTSQLRRLKIEFFDILHNQNNQIPFEKLSELKNLNSLELKFDMWPNGLGAFLQKIETFPLSKFCLETAIVDESQLLWIKMLLSRLGNLECLKLRISKESAFQSKECIRGVMEKIASLRFLKTLKVEFLVPGLTEKQEDLEEIDEAFIPTLKNIFLRAHKLQKVSVRCNQVNSRNVFMNIVSSASRIASKLQKLEINIGVFLPTENDFKQITDFAERLTNIEILKLMSISGSMSQPMQNFLNTVQGLKYLKEFEIYELKGNLNKKTFVSTIEKLLSKRGLEKFNCCLTRDAKETGIRRPKGYQIDPKKILEKNPSLRSYPESHVIFSCYNDDNSWKWS